MTPGNSAWAPKPVGGFLRGVNAAGKEQPKDDSKVAKPVANKDDPKAVIAAADPKIVEKAVAKVAEKASTAQGSKKELATT